MTSEATVGRMQQDDWESANADARVLARAINGLVQGDATGPGGIESLVMALTGNSVSGRTSLPRQLHEGLTAVANSIDNLADAYRERTRKLG